MKLEFASILTQQMIEMLLNVHALTNMHRSSNNEEYRQTAAEWLPRMRRQLDALERELTKPKEPT